MYYPSFSSGSRYWTVFATLRTVQLVPFFKQVAGRWCLASISKQLEMCRLVPCMGISSYFHITKPQSCLFDRLRWVLKTICFFFFLSIHNPKKVQVRELHCAHQQPPCSTQTYMAWIYTNAKLYSHTVNVFVGLDISFLVCKCVQLFFFISNGYTEFSLTLWLGCWQFLYAALYHG